MRDSAKAWAWPRAMMAIQHAIMFCMVYPLHAHFEVVERLGRSAVVCNKSMDVLYVVRKTLDEVAKLQHCRRTRDGFYVGADWIKQQYPGMNADSTTSTAKPKKAPMNKGKGKGRRNRDNDRHGSGRGGFNGNDGHRGGRGGQGGRGRGFDGGRGRGRGHRGN